MRTTIRLDDALLAEAKRHAADTGRTLTHLIEDALRETLSRRQQAARRKRVELPTFHGSGVHPGVNLDSNAALLDLMEGLD
jgi:hypothetical protein